MAKMKKLGGVVAVIAMSLALGACGLDNGVQPSSIPSQPSELSFQSSGSPSQTSLDPQDEVGGMVVPSLHTTLTLSVMGSSRAYGVVAVTPYGTKVGMGETQEIVYIPGKRVTLTAISKTSRFGGWSGACRYQGATCTLSMKADQTVEAYFFR